jgi:hypothetical protein
MERNKESTSYLLAKIAAQAVEIQATVDEIEPEYCPNGNLQLILSLLNLIRQEGSVYHKILCYVADSCHVHVDDLYRHLEKLNQPNQDYEIRNQETR